MEKKLNFFIASSWGFVFTIVTFQFSFCSSERGAILKSCTRDGTFRITFGQPFEKCIEECQRRRRCELIMYKHGINECSLKDFINVTALAEVEPICLFAGDQEKVKIAPCDKASCGLTEKCVTSRSDPNRFECVQSECLRPPAISHAKVLVNLHSINNRNCYQCEQNYVGVGNPFITCTQDCTWSLTNFSCVRLGRKPRSDLKYADLTNVIGERWLAGTELHFTCRPGYQGKGIIASSVITRHGKFKPNVVQCCNENITQDIVGTDCVQTFNASFATEFQDISDHCENKGGTMTSIRSVRSFAKKGFVNEEYRFLWTNTSKNKNMLRLLEDCLEKNNVTETYDSYEELQKIVVSTNMTGGWTCDTARWWKNGEPDGGDREDCVVLSTSDFLLFDVSCTDWGRIGKEYHAYICSFSLPKI